MILKEYRHPDSSGRQPLWLSKTRTSREDVIHQKLVYLHNNPVVEGYVDKAEEYFYSSARDYYYDKNCGLLEIKFITE